MKSKLIIYDIYIIKSIIKKGFRSINKILEQKRKKNINLISRRFHNYKLHFMEYKTFKKLDTKEDDDSYEEHEEEEKNFNIC